MTVIQWECRVIVVCVFRHWWTEYTGSSTDTERCSCWCSYHRCYSDHYLFISQVNSTVADNKTDFCYRPH